MAIAKTYVVETSQRSLDAMPNCNSQLTKVIFSHSCHELKKVGMAAGVFRLASDNYIESSSLEGGTR